MKLVVPLHSLYWSIHTKDESKREMAFAFIFGVNWLWRCGVKPSFGVSFHEIRCNGVTSLHGIHQVQPQRSDSSPVRIFDTAILHSCTSSSQSRIFCAHDQWISLTPGVSVGPYITWPEVKLKHSGATKEGQWHHRRVIGLVTTGQVLLCFAGLRWALRVCSRGTLCPLMYYFKILLTLAISGYAVHLKSVHLVYLYIYFMVRYIVGEENKI